MLHSRESGREGEKANQPASSQPAWPEVVAVVCTHLLACRLSLTQSSPLPAAAAPCMQTDGPTDGLTLPPHGETATPRPSQLRSTCLVPLPRTALPLPSVRRPLLRLRELQREHYYQPL